MSSETPGEPAALRPRRSFLDGFLAATGAAFLFSVLYPILRYLVPPRTGESMASSVTLPVKAADVKPNSGQIFPFGNKPAIVLRTPRGELRAFIAICTHLGCTVQYRTDLGQIWCACHNGHFDLNGTNVSGPPPRPLEALVVKEQGDRIVLRRA